MDNFSKFFYLEKKDNELSKALQGSQDTGETRGKMAEYRDKLIENTKSKKELLDLMKRIPPSPQSPIPGPGPGPVPVA